MRPLLLCALLLAPAGCSRPAPDAVTFPTTEGSGRGLLFVPAAKGPRPAVVLLHDDFGLTDAVTGHARWLADRGYPVLAVDLYRGEKVDNQLDAHIMDRGLSEERVKADVGGALDFLDNRADVRKGALAVMGLGMGGGYALDAALADPRIKAVVTCYGRLTTDPDLLAPMKASVLGVYAGKDEGNSPETLEAFREAMRKAGKRLTGLRVIPEVDQGFLTPREGETDRAAVGMARKWIEEYLAAEIGSR